MFEVECEREGVTEQELVEGDGHRRGSLCGEQIVMWVKDVGLLQLVISIHPGKL